MNPFLSLIVPTRGRPVQLRRFLESLVETMADPQSVELVLVIDADDPESAGIGQPSLSIRHVVCEPGQTMGALNSAGYNSARGRWLMLLNDDVIARTANWDLSIRACTAAFPDEIFLLHVNDGVFRKELCTFPIVSRTFCEIVGGICSRAYRRYRIDDHIEDHFNLLAVLGERRIVYAPDIVFEHQNYVTNPHGVRQYFSEPATLALDAPLFDALFAERKEAALRLKAHIAGWAEILPRWRHALAQVSDPFSLRTADRQRVLTPGGIVDLWTPRPSLPQRIWDCARQRGWRGLARALRRRLAAPFRA